VPPVNEHVMHAIALLHDANTSFDLALDSHLGGMADSIHPGWSAQAIAKATAGTIHSPPMTRSPFTLNGWLPLVTACLAIILTSCSLIPAHQAAHHPKGRARYEILGMLDEYGGRPLYDAASIESFYGNEKPAADHFEKVLGEFCAEESLPKDWRRADAGGGGRIEFTGTRIASAINASYTKDARAGFGLYDVGVVSASVRRAASRDDMLRYVAGAYIRYGDPDHPSGPGADRRAFINVANNYTKLSLLTDFLTRLGCTNLRYYIDDSSAPTGSLLAFTPTPEVKAATGVAREITEAEIKKWNPSLKLQTKLPHVPVARKAPH